MIANIPSASLVLVIKELKTLREGTYPELNLNSKQTNKKPKQPNPPKQLNKMLLCMLIDIKSETLCMFLNLLKIPGKQIKIR